jgi:hypothetical protein
MELTVVQLLHLYPEEVEEVVKAAIQSIYHQAREALVALAVVWAEGF